MIVRNTTGEITREEWWKDGYQHRDGGPAIIERNPVTGTVTCEEWRKNGRIERFHIDLPGAVYFVKRT